MSKIYLVRHAQSKSNIDKTFLIENTNISVPLTETGILQATDTSLFLSNDIVGSVKIWNSPYQRTRNTADLIKFSLAQQQKTFTAEESIYICERQFGLLDDNPDYMNTHSLEHEHYKLHYDNKHDFWARPPLGESPFDMCMRLDFFIRSVLYEENFDNHIIVSHGAAIRGFITMHQKLKFEDYTEMKNPFNASVNLINNGVFDGVVFCPKERTN
jgi:broad specificity phosphatase PhoE